MNRTKPPTRVKSISKKAIELEKQRKKFDPTKVYTKEELENLLFPEEIMFIRTYVTNGWDHISAYQHAYSIYRDLTNEERLKAGRERNKLKGAGIGSKYVKILLADVEELLGISKLSQVMEYKQIAYSNISNYHDTWIDIKEFERIPIHVRAAIKSTETVSEVQLDENFKQVKVTKVKIELHDKIKALREIDKLMKYHEANKFTIETTINNKVDITKYTDEEKALLLKMARKNEY